MEDVCAKILLVRVQALAMSDWVHARGNGESYSSQEHSANGLPVLSGVACTSRSCCALRRCLAARHARSDCRDRPWGV